MGLAAQFAGLADGAKARLFGRGDSNAVPAAARALTYLSTLDPSSAKRMKDYESYLGAITIPNVYKCLALIANTFSATQLHLLDEDDNEVDPKDRLPEFDALLRRPNPEMRGRHFRQILSHHLQLTGNAVVLLDNDDGLGRPTELYVLRPDKLHIIRSDVGKLAYGYDVEANRTTKTIWYDGDSVLHVKLAHPTDPLWGFGTIEGGELTFSKDRLVNEFALNFFARGAILDGVLTTPGEIPEEDRRALVADWRAMREGARNKIRTALLWAGASYTPIQEPLGRVPIADLVKMGLDDIAQLFGVPLQLLGGSGFSESNYRNAQEAVQFFYGETLAPILRQFEEDFWNPLLELFDPGLRAEYEQREVIDYAMRADAAAKLAGTGAFSVNDLRVSAGYDPLPDDDELGGLIPLPKGMTLLSPEQAAQLGEQLQEAPEELPPAPQVTELGQPAPAPAAAAPAPRQQPAAAQRGAAGVPQTAPEPRSGKSEHAARAGAKSYPAALLSPSARHDQRRRQLEHPRTPHAARQTPPLWLLPSAKADASDAASRASADGASGPPRSPGAAGSPAQTSDPSRRLRVHARPEQSDVERLTRAYAQWASADDDDAWALAVQSASAQRDDSPHQAGDEAAPDR
jgi:HK97 family phage portal protein